VRCVASDIVPFTFIVNTFSNKRRRKKNTTQQTQKNCQSHQQKLTSSGLVAIGDEYAPTPAVTLKNGVKNTIYINDNNNNNNNNSKHKKTFRHDWKTTITIETNNAEYRNVLNIPIFLHTRG
jgi:hypothetical protein